MENFKRIDSHWINPESPWNMIRGKYLFENPKILNKDSKENNLLSLTLNGVLNKDMDSGGGLRPDSYESYQIFYENDLVFKLIDLENVKTSRVGWVHERGLMSPVYIRLKPKEDKTNTRYFYYYFFDLYQRHIFNSIGSGIRSSLSGTNLLELLVPNPSHEEQNKIVSFLDKKTTQIDKLIKQIEQKIDLLKEQKTSLISEVVTKGLNPNVEMKESGVEWISEIPSNWEIKKLKYLVKHIKEKNTPGEEDIKISPEYVESDTGICFNQYSEHSGDGYKFIHGDILLNKLRIYLKKFLLVDFEGYSIGEMIVLRTEKKDHSEFIFNCLFSDDLIRYLNSFSTGVKVPRVSPDAILSTKFPLPPTEEISKINEFIKHNNVKIYNQISIEEKRIKLLKEYKQSLISEVVTGKKRVVG